MKREFAAYPLFVKDPYFSLWANTETVNESAPVFWVGNKKILNGYIIVDGKRYDFLGEGNGNLRQTAIRTRGYETICSFTCETFDLEIRFVSPLFIDDLETLSCPVCYLMYDIAPKKELRNATVHFEAEERICYDTANDAERKEDTVTTVTKYCGFEGASVGLRRQAVLSSCNDACGADSGYWHIAGQVCCTQERDGRKFVCAQNAFSEHGFFMLGYDDIISVNYFGRPLAGYWFRDGKTMTDALQVSFDTAESVFRRCNEYYEKYLAEWNVHGEDYVKICNAALVQTVGAHKLVRDCQTGDVLFLSHECGSGACTATADVSYPSAPLFLRYNPALLRGMLYPIFEFARKPVWTYPFAPHDAGMYPLVYGQQYALRYDGKYTKNFASGGKFTVAKVYDAPPNEEYYDYEKQMPVEESANMLILTYAAYRADGDTALIQKQFDLLTKWADYLEANGNAVENQLTTDDFCGRKANSINLAIKATVALCAYSEMCKIMSCDGAVYREKSERLATYIQSFSDTYGHLPSAFDSDGNTFGLKYNLAFDLALDFKLFDEKTYAREVECYQKQLRKYGVPLYDDITCTKSDWLAFIACFSDDTQYRSSIFAAIARYMRETTHRVPFPDWYDTELPDKDESSLFRNRSVQGGMFMPLLIGTKC